MLKDRLEEGGQSKWGERPPFAPADLQLTSSALIWNSLRSLRVLCVAAVSISDGDSPQRRGGCRASTEEDLKLGHLSLTHFVFAASQNFTFDSLTLCVVDLQTGVLAVREIDKS